METIRLNYPHSKNFSNNRPASAAIGSFDGVHLGHQAVILAAKERAKEMGIKSAVITFDPHPIEALKGQKLQNYLLMSLAQKEQILDDLGIDYLYVIHFNEAFSKLKPQEFVDQYLVGLNIKHLIAGFDFSFGHKGAGKMADMEAYAKNRFTFSIVEKIVDEEEKISSTRIRKLIQNGDVSSASNLLGRPYSLMGEVKKGFQRGRDLGYPTANLDIDMRQTIPKNGIYAVRATVAGANYDGMASIGYNPTFEEVHTTPSVEIHLFDFDEDIYGESMEVFMIKYLREEVRFDTVDALVAQLKEDEINSKKILRDEQK